jgi:hypothetical protein
MAYVTIEADIEGGRIIPKEPGKLPDKGKALVTVVEESTKKPDWDKIMSLLGHLKSIPDGLTFERNVRAEWAERERKQWINR